MKKIFRLLLCLSVLTMAFASFTCEAAKKVVAVAGVENQTRSYHGANAARQLESELTTALVKSGMYEVVERSQLDYVIRELNLQNSGMIVGDKAIQFGQMTGADYTIVGNVVAADVQRFNNYLYKGTKGKVKLNFKFIDNKTGRIKIAEILEGSDTVSEFENKSPDRDIMITGAVNDLAQKIVDILKPQLSGMIVAVKGDVIYTDLGSDMGIRTGEEFIIYREGNIVKHPVTGEIITVEENNIGKLKITEVKSNYSIGEIKKNKGEIRVGDKVKRGGK